MPKQTAFEFTQKELRLNELEDIALEALQNEVEFTDKIYNWLSPNELKEYKKLKKEIGL